MRDENVVRRDCAMWALIADMERIKIKSAGMQAVNAQRAYQDLPPEYRADEFINLADAMGKVAKKLREL